MDINWFDECEEHNYPAAKSYLSLIMSPDRAEEIVARLKDSETEEYKAKDIVRASGLKMLSKDNNHVEKDLKKLDDEKNISPILLVRDIMNSKVIVADGYHRLSAIYLADEDAFVHCKIVDF